MPRKTATRAAPAKTAASSVVKNLPDGPPDENGLTPRQRKVLDVIRDSVERRGYPPTIREIGAAVGLASTSSVSYQLSVLQGKGFLRRDPTKPRAVDVRLPSEVAAGNDEADARAAHPTPAYVPHNESFSPIPGDEAVILGRVVTVLRKV